MGLKVIVDVMHGSAAGCISELLGAEGQDIVQEIRNEWDPLFGGHKESREKSFAFSKEFMSKHLLND